MVKAKKSLGQNFLKDAKILEKIVEAAELKNTDTVLEIGPGKGALTEDLLNKAKKVIAVELDQRLIAPLTAQFRTHNNFELIHEDALKYSPPKGPYKIVANIPYYITSPLLNHFLLEQFLNGNPPELIVFMVQKEVAEKILAKNKNHSVLSLEVHCFGEPSHITDVPASSFSPPPKVDSTVIKIKVFPKPKIQGDLKKFIWLLHISFAQKRKKLSNNLSAALRKSPQEIRELLTKLNINPELRAEALDFKDWQKLMNALEKS